MDLRKLPLLAACSLWAAPLFAQLPVSTSPENKNVVLEEFTGIYCTYCPDGHKRANDLAENNPGDVFLINIHTGGYANPSGSDPDYRTSFGSGLAGQSDLAGYPAGTINRHYFPSYNQNGGTAMSRGDWDNASSVILSQSAYANVAVEGVVNADNRELTVNVEVYFTSDGAQSNNLNVALLQDSIWGPQTGGSTYYPAHWENGQYLHMHMLRHLITGQWGEEINNTSSGNKVSKEYNYTVPNDINGVPVKLEDLKLVAFLDTGQQEVITGNDGPVKMSATSVEDTKDGGEDVSMTLYPNPVREMLRLNIQSGTSLEGRLEVRDMTGRLIREENALRVDSGSDPITLDMSDEENGMYFVRFVSEKGSFTKRFSVIGN